MSAIVGLVILVGIVAVGSVTVLVIGGDIQQGTEDTITDERIEDSFVQLDQRIATVATGQTRESTVDFALTDDPKADTAIRREDTGRIVINRTNLTTTKTVAVKDIGSIVYTRDGEQYTYQAGAVWRNEGNATELVAAPQVSYEFSTQSGYASPTLNLAIPELQGADRIPSGRIAVRHNRTIAPFNNVSTVENQLITMSVTSDYYVGWGRYFEQRYESITTVSYDHPNDTVTVEFGTVGIGGNYSGAIAGSGNLYIGNGNPSTSGPLQAGSTSGSTGSPPSPVKCTSSGGSVDCTPTSFTPLDSVINARIQDARSDYTDVSSDLGDGSDTTLTAGTYYTDEFKLSSETLTFDLSGGNVSLYVDGPIGMNGGAIEVENTNVNSTCCFARVYVGDTSGNGYGDFALANGGTEVSVDDGEAQHFQLYGTSEMQFEIGQGDFTGAVYAPHGGDKASGDNAVRTVWPSFPDSSGSTCASPDVCVGIGNPDFKGALVGFHDVDVRQAADVSFGPSVANVDPTLGYAGVVPPPITFLQVSVQQVCIGEDETNC